MGFQNVYAKIKTKYQYVDADSPGCFIQVCAFFENCVLGFDGLGEKGKPAEEIGKRVGEMFKSALNNPPGADIYMLDQLIPYIALVVSTTGNSVKIKYSELSMHTHTNMWVVKQFLPVEFEIHQDVLECRKKA